MKTLTQKDLFTVSGGVISDTSLELWEQGCTPER